MVGRAPLGLFAGVRVLVGLVVLLVTVAAAYADRSPAGCLGSGLGITFVASLADIHIGDTIHYNVTVFNSPFPACDAGQTDPAAAGAVQAFVVTPDGVTNALALRRTFLVPGDTDEYTNVLSYVLRAEDVFPDGTVHTTVTVQGEIHRSAFIPGGGVFSGLFFDSNDVQTRSSGCFNLSLTGAGAYRGTLQNRGKRYPVRGTFDATGQATNTIRRGKESPLTVNWQRALSDSDYLSGTVSDGTFVAQLDGARAGFSAANPAPQAGRYTLTIPGLEQATNSPDGDGYGTATVAADGVVQFKGRLADDTVVVQKGALCQDGEWPVFISLYQGQGMLLGWLQVADDGTNDLSGRLRWMKPNLPRSKLYKAGFSVNGQVMGSHYVPPVGTARMLQDTNGVLLLSGGNLPTCSNPVTLGPRNSFVNHGPNALKLSFSPASGFFAGSFKAAGATTTFALRGAVLQRQNHGSGYAPSSEQSGRVLVRAAP